MVNHLAVRRHQVVTGMSKAISMGAHLVRNRPRNQDLASIKSRLSRCRHPSFRFLTTLIILVATSLSLALVPAPALAKASSPMHPARLPAGLGLTGDSSDISDITCPSQNQCLAVGNGTKGAVLLRTTNGGASWSRVTLPSGQGLVDHSIGFINTITCPSQNQCLVVGNGTKGAVLLRSTNGGVSWSRVTLPSGLGLVSHHVLLNQISCSTVRRCLATGFAGIGPAVLLGSSNGGASWSRVTLLRGQGLVNHPIGFISTISCPSRTQCLVGLSLDTKGAMIDLINMRNLAQGSTVLTPRVIDVAVVFVLVVLSMYLVRRRHATATRPAPDAVSVDTTH